MEALPKDHFLFTSESVNQGHPDKLCDYVSDSILDACLAEDPDSRVACETSAKNNLCMVFGEITTKAKISFESVVRQAIKDIGYDNIDKGMDYKTAVVLVSLDKQSPEIDEAVSKTEKKQEKKPEEIGAGDQGMMVGYATDETPEFMPMTHHLAGRLCERLLKCRKEEIIPWLLPDGKSQKKAPDGGLIPVRAHTILISTQHKANIPLEEIQQQVKEKVIKEVVPKELIDEKTKFLINPSKSFVIGGPTGDAGLTGRKIIVDSYGGWGSHGGGCFSGKDCTKVDRSGAYAGRWIAKSLVSSGLCRRCTVQISYGIGIPEPLSLFVDSFGSVKAPLTDNDLKDIILKSFDLRPGCLIRDLKLKRPFYKKTTCFGHFGRKDPDFLWEHPKDLSKFLHKK